MPSRSPPQGDKVLLLTLGSTPQVVTETLYALATGSPAWIPDRIVLATTEHGARIFQEGRQFPGREPFGPLLGADGMLARLIGACDLPLSLDCVEVIVPRCGEGMPINDIRTVEETKAFAEELLAIVAEITSIPGSELHVSLAGGRKTMSFIAGQVMSIFGRKQDHLSHVLIEPRELEWQDSFWWPGDGSPNSEDARIGLYQVPYLRARAWLDPATVMNVNAGFANAVDKANQSLGHVPITIDLPRRHLAVCGQQIELGAQQLATLGLIAIAAKRGVDLQTVAGWHPIDPKVRGLTLGGNFELARRLWVFFYHCCHLDRHYNPGLTDPFSDLNKAILRSLPDFEVDKQVSSPLSRMRKELGQELPPALAEKIIAPRGLATLLDPGDITIIGPADLADHQDWPDEMVSKG